MLIMNKLRAMNDCLDLHAMIQIINDNLKKESNEIRASGQRNFINNHGIAQIPVVVEYCNEMDDMKFDRIAIICSRIAVFALDAPVIPTKKIEYGGKKCLTTFLSHFCCCSV